MTTTLSSAESKTEDVYRTMTDDELQSLLSQETCLDQKLLLRKELRTRRNTRALTRAVSQVHTDLDKDVEPPVIQSSRNKVLSIHPQEEKNENTKPNTAVQEDNKSTIPLYSPEIQNELDILLKELRNTLDVNRRRNLRLKIKELHENTNSNYCPTSPHPKFNYADEVDKSKESRVLKHQSKEQDIVKKPQEEVKSFSKTNKSQVLLKNPSKESNLSISVSEGKTTKDYVPRIQSGRDKADHFIITKDPEVREHLNSYVSDQNSQKKSPKPQINNTQLKSEEMKPKTVEKMTFKAEENLPKSRKRESHKVKFREKEDVVLQYKSTTIGLENETISWFFENKPIATYPKSYFSNLQFSERKGSYVTLQFSECSEKRHQGRFRLEIVSKNLILEVIFEITVENQVIIEEGSHNKNKILSVNETKDTISNNMISKPSATFIKDSLSRMKQSEINEVKDSRPSTSLIKDSTSRIKPSEVKPVIESRPSTSLDKDSSLRMKQSEENPILETSPKEMRKTNMSRVSSMREMFEKKPETNISRHNSNYQRKVGVPTPLGKELEDMIKEENYIPVENKVITSLKSSEVLQSGLGPPSQQSRKISQTGIMKMIPMMKSKAKIARSSVQQMKDLIINFCKYNTQEYENINITNYSGSWADGLAFCALIHHFYPDAFDYSKLTPNNRTHNFNLAFDTARDRAGIDPLLDAEDMIILDQPDWKCVYTYVQTIYSKLKTHPRNLMKKPEEPHL